MGHITGDVLKNDGKILHKCIYSNMSDDTINLIKPFCSNMKYWDSNKSTDVGYQKTQQRTNLAGKEL